MYNRTATWKGKSIQIWLFFTSGGWGEDLDDCSDQVEDEEEGGGEVEDLHREDDEDKDGVAGEEQA